MAVREDGLPGLAFTAALRPANEEGASTQELEPVHPGEIELDFAAWIRDLEAELARTTGARAVGAGERAILVSVSAGRDAETLATHVAELKELARSAGVEVIDVITQFRPHVDPRTLVGSGKLDDLVIRCFQQDIDLVIFDQDLTPEPGAQPRRRGWSCG